MTYSSEPQQIQTVSPCEKKNNHYICQKNENKENFRNYRIQASETNMKLSDRAIMYLPIIMNAILFWMCIEWLVGVNYISDYSYTFFGYSFIVILLLFILSVERKFCLWHRLLLYNMTLSIWFETLMLFGIVIPVEMFILTGSTAVTLLISLYLLRKNGCFKK